MNPAMLYGGEKVTVKVYSTPTCPYCNLAKQFLKENNVIFEDVNVAEDREAIMNMIRKSGQMGVPVLDVDGKIIVGFNKEAIKEALKL